MEKNIYGIHHIALKACGVENFDEILQHSDGYDACRKIAILTAVASGKLVKTDDNRRRIGTSARKTRFKRNFLFNMNCNRRLLADCFIKLLCSFIGNILFVNLINEIPEFNILVELCLQLLSHQYL